MRRILSEELPDFVVFSGDQVSGYAIASEQLRQSLWIEALNVTASFQIPFATIFGNHDDQPFHLDPLLWFGLANYCMLFVVMGLFAIHLYGHRLSKIPKCLIYTFLLPIPLIYFLTGPVDMTRNVLLQTELSHFNGLSYTRQGPRELHGISNYNLTLQTPAGASVDLFFLDSGGGRIPESVHQDQIDWLEKSATPNPSLAFVHIPPQQFGTGFNQTKCNGSSLEQSTDSLSGSWGLLGLFDKMGVRAVFVGHDHGNSWCCNQQGMLMCYGRHSGFGGYDFNSSRGARIINLDIENASHVLITSWVNEVLFY